MQFNPLLKIRYTDIHSVRQVTLLSYSVKCYNVSFPSVLWAHVMNSLVITVISQ